MKIFSKIYEKIYKRKAPYYMHYSILKILGKPIRKYFSAVIIPSIPFNNIRIILYRCCGYKIGKHVFIGMRCYLDDMCYSCIEIKDNVTISYGVFFACHGKKQEHTNITICENAYIGMNASLISGKEGIEIGANAIIGACSLVNKSVPANTTAVEYKGLVPYDQSTKYLKQYFALIFPTFFSGEGFPGTIIDA